MLWIGGGNDLVATTVRRVAERGDLLPAGRGLRRSGDRVHADQADLHRAAARRTRSGCCTARRPASSSGIRPAATPSGTGRSPWARRTRSPSTRSSRRSLPLTETDGMSDKEIKAEQRRRSGDPVLLHRHAAQADPGRAGRGRAPSRRARRRAWDGTATAMRWRATATVTTRSPPARRTTGRTTWPSRPPGTKERPTRIRAGRFRLPPSPPRLACPLAESNVTSETRAVRRLHPAYSAKFRRTVRAVCGPLSLLELIRGAYALCRSGRDRREAVTTPEQIPRT